MKINIESEVLLMILKELKNNIFLKNSILYVIGGLMTPFVGFFMLPVYTQYLNPTEYAIMTTVQTLVGMLEILLVLSLKSAITRFFYDFMDDTEKLKEYLGSIYIFVLLFSTIFSVILLFFNDSLGALLFKKIPINPFYFYLIGLSWISALLSLPMALFRAQEKAALFVIINVIKAISIMGLTAYMIIGKGLGAESALISQFSITFIIVLITISMQYRYLKFSLNMSLVKQSLIYSIPMLPHVATVWIINSSDRIILEKYVDINDLGIYALAVQISMVLALFYTSVNNAFVPRYIKLKKEGDDSKANKILRIFSFVVVIFGLLSIPVAMIGLKFITTSQYHGAILLLPSLLIGQIIKGFYYIPVAKLLYKKKTKSIATSSTIAAVLNIIINILLIPMIGIWGAIVSTIISEIVRLLLMYKASKRIYHSH